MVDVAHVAKAAKAASAFLGKAKMGAKVVCSLEVESG